MLPGGLVTLIIRGFMFSSDKSIKANPYDRFQDAKEFLDNLDVVIFKISKEAHALDLAAPQQCLYCVVGKYAVLTEGPDELRLKCMYCGTYKASWAGSGGNPDFRPP
jgi:hypothetical protein